MIRTSPIVVGTVAGLLVVGVSVVTQAPLLAGSQVSKTEVAALVAKIAELEGKLDRLSTREQIRDVYRRYMRGFDRSDVALLQSAFWPDVQINYGTQSNTFDEFVARHLNLHTAQLESWGHLITNESIEVTGDLAHVEVYVTALFVPKDEKSFANGRPIVGGRYVDRVERRNGEWRIAVREFIPHFSLRTNPSTFHKPDWPGWSRSVCGLGTWDKRDPSYRRPLTRRASKEIGPDCAE